jgi:hypothetical protein
MNDVGPGRLPRHCVAQVNIRERRPAEADRLESRKPNRTEIVPVPAASNGRRFQGRGRVGNRTTGASFGLASSIVGHCRPGVCRSPYFDLRAGPFRVRARCSVMAQSFGDEIQLVEVTTDDLVRGEPKKQLWAAAAGSELAVTLVLAAVPEGWAAALSDVQLEPEEVAELKMQPGEVRELTK